MRLSLESKIDEYIHLLNDGIIIPKTNDKINKFSNGDNIGFFFNNHKNQIYYEVMNNLKYKECSNAIKIMHCKMDELDYIADYIELVNTNSIKVLCTDLNNFFTNGKKIGSFYRNNKEEINNRLLNDSKYNVGYENAKKKILDKSIFKLDEYIDMVNNGKLQIKNYDFITKFSNGDIVHRFWVINKDRIYNSINNDIRFKNGYDNARKLINEAYSIIKVIKELSIDEKIEEYIELLKKKKIYVSDLDIKNKFSNGESINKFLIRYKDKIIDKLNEDKYKVGYEDVKEQILEHSTTDNLIDEFIDYAEVNLDGITTSTVVLSNGSKVMYFLSNHNKQIKYRLEHCSKYKKGYKNLKRRLGVNCTSRKEIEEELEEMIVKLNDSKYDLSYRTTTNTYLYNYFYSNKKKIIKKVLEDPKYKDGYEVIKTRLFGFSKIDEYIDLINTYGINVEKEEELCFSDGSKIGNFWVINKDAIANHLKKYNRYGIGYELARLKVKNGCSTFYKSKEYIRKMEICDKYLIDFELNKDILSYIPSEMLEPIINLLDENKIQYRTNEGKLTKVILVTEKELIVNYGLDINNLINDKEKVNTL